MCVNIVFCHRIKVSRITWNFILELGYQLYAFKQGYHTVLIYKSRPYFEVICLRKYFCPYF